MPLAWALFLVKIFQNELSQNGAQAMYFLNFDGIEDQ